MRRRKMRGPFDRESCEFHSLLRSGEKPRPTARTWQAAGALKHLVGIEQDGDRAVVHKLEGHMRLKYSGFDAQVQRLQRAHKFLVACLALVGRSRLQETWTPLAARVAVQRELRYGQYGAARVEKREVHLALGVVEYSQLNDFLGHRGCRFGRIFASHGNQDHEP